MRIRLSGTLADNHNAGSILGLSSGLSLRDTQLTNTGGTISDATIDRSVIDGGLVHGSVLLRSSRIQGGATVVFDGRFGGGLLDSVTTTAP